MRFGRQASLILTLAALAVPANAFAHQPLSAPSGTLSATNHQVRAGDGVTLEATVCPKGQSVVEVRQRTVREGDTAATVPFEPLNLDAISLDQSDVGASFTITAEEARTTLWFRLDCSDGSSVTTTDPVTVFPPSGEFWWMFNTPGRFATAAGSTLALRMISMDCDTSFVAEVSMYGPDGGEPMLQVQAPFAHDGSVAVDLPFPTGIADGVYVVQVTCSSWKSDGITDGVPVYVTASSGGLPPTGSDRGLLVAAALLLALGAALLLGAGSRRATAG